MQRFASWIEPSIVAEWMRIMKGYARNMERELDEARVAAAAEHGTSRIATWTAAIVAHWRYWTAPRSTASGAAKGWTPRALDIDHAFPWSAWPCGDLWNLLPAHRSVNQHKKRQKLPTDRLLLSQQDKINSWWRDAYEQDRASRVAVCGAGEDEPAFARRRSGRGVRRGLRRHACPAVAAMARPANTRVERVIGHTPLR